MSEDFSLALAIPIMLRERVAPPARRRPRHFRFPSAALASGCDRDGFQLLFGTDRPACQATAFEREHWHYLSVYLLLAVVVQVVALPEPKRKQIRLGSQLQIHNRRIMIAFIHWGVNPIAFSMGPVAVRWYGICFATAFITGLGIMRRIFRLEDQTLAEIDVLFAYILLGTIVGARLAHILFYEPVYYFTHPAEIIAVWHGGLASHGGAVGMLIALWLYSRKRPGQRWLWLVDRLCLPAAIGGSFVRIGNLFNSEILGIPTRLPWAVVFTRVDVQPRHPAMVYEAFAYALIFIVLAGIYRRYRVRLVDGVLTGFFLVLVFGFRFAIEFVKVRQSDFGHGMPLTMGQILSIPMLLAGAWLLVRAARHRPATESGPAAPPAS